MKRSPLKVVEKCRKIVQEAIHVRCKSGTLGTTRIGRLKITLGVLAVVK